MKVYHILSRQTVPCEGKTCCGGSIYKHSILFDLDAAKIEFEEAKSDFNNGKDENPNFNRFEVLFFESEIEMLGKYSLV